VRLDSIRLHRLPNAHLVLWALTRQARAPRVVYHVLQASTRLQVAPPAVLNAQLENLPTPVLLRVRVALLYVRLVCTHQAGIRLARTALRVILPRTMELRHVPLAFLGPTAPRRDCLQ